MTGKVGARSDARSQDTGLVVLVRVLGSDYRPRHHAHGYWDERTRFSVKEKDETSRQEGILPNSLKPSFPDLSESGGFLF